MAVEKNKRLSKGKKGIKKLIVGGFGAKWARKVFGHCRVLMLQVLMIKNHP
jgi:hypothetical protein